MALAHDDIWQKFDLFADQRGAKHVESGVIDNIPDIIGDSLGESNYVPDISDFLFDFGQSDSFENIDFANNSLLNSADDRLNSMAPSCGRVLDLAFIDLENLESSETLRHDCMWSGLCPSEEHKHQKSRKDNVTKQATPSVKMHITSSPHARLSVFDTPIQSDLDTSDLDETFSECDEIDVENIAALDRLVIPPEKLSNTPVDNGAKSSDHTYTDHCYIAPKQVQHSNEPAGLLNMLTPAQSSEDEDIQREGILGKPASLLRPANKNKKGKEFLNTIKTRPPKALHMYDQTNQSEAKFRFQMKFTSDGSSPKSRSLLRHPSRLNRTHYTKRKAVVKNSFCPSAMKQIQVQKVRHMHNLEQHRLTKHSLQIQKNGMVQMDQKVKERKSHKHRDKGDKCRDVRDLHNSMERQRRVDLKNAFDGLKICVPEIADSDRASKLMILDKAADFCQSLKKKESSLSGEKDKEKRKNTLLRKKLSMLQTHQNSSLQKCTRKVFL